MSDRLLNMTFDLAELRTLRVRYLIIMQDVVGGDFKCLEADVRRLTTDIKTIERWVREAMAEEANDDPAV